MKKLIKRVLKAMNKSVVYSRKKCIFFRQNTANNYHLSPSTIRKAHRMGFTADEYFIYGLDKNSPSDYISEFERSLYRGRMRDKSVILDNKILFYSIIRNFADTNTIYAYRVDGKYVCLEENFELEQIPERLRELGKIVYKINFAGGGKGLRMLEYDGNDYLINRKKASLREIQELLSTGDYFLEEFCVQGDFLNALFPYAVNTIRIITAEGLDKNISILLAAQRIGMDPNSCVDNGDAGGIPAKIDLDTGRINIAHSYAKGSYVEEEKFAGYKNHPVTGHPIEGLIIPDWEQIKSQLIDLHHQLRFLDFPMISWDVALTNSGFKIIEANTSNSMEMQFLYGGLRKKEFGRWMKERGYIK